MGLQQRKCSTFEMGVGHKKTEPERTRFEVEALREAAGEKVFARGQAYYKDGQVEITAIDSACVVARVIGTEIYRTKLKGSGRRFAGECSCPAFSDHGFCKHLVATALAANSLPSYQIREIGSRFARIREHLRTQGVDVLVEKFMALAERDPALLQDLELAAAADTQDDKTILSRFRGAIADATSTRGFVEYREVGDWASGIESVLERIEGLVGAGRAAIALTLLGDFFDEMEEALGQVDDSDGQGGEIVVRTSEIHLKACRAAKPDPIELARDLFAREVESDWDFFHGASETYADILGEAGLTEYRRLAEEAWAKVKPLRAGPRRVDEDWCGTRNKLRSILEGFAARVGDLDARIAVRGKDLSSAYDYLGIAELCLSHGRETQALQWAEEGLWQFEDNPDERLIVFTASLYMRLGRPANAEKLLWQAFEHAPSLDLYKRIKNILSVDEAAAGIIMDRAAAFLRTQIAKPRERTSLRWAATADLLINVLMVENRVEDAWNIARVHGGSEGLLMTLAEASETSHPNDAWKAYAGRVERIVSLGGQRNYEDACKLIKRMGRLRERPGETAVHTVWLADLTTRHKAKRNFLKLLRI